jgi:hypothetical protein
MAVSRDTIRQLFTRSVTDATLLGEFSLYDTSVTQKLWSVDYYLKALSTLDIGEFNTPTASSATATAGFDIPDPATISIELFLRQFNLNLDGFFMNAMSVLDTLAHQICVLYTLTNVPRSIYVDTAQRLLASGFPNSHARSFLDAQLAPGAWFSEFEPFRHCTTHESLIRYEDIQLTVNAVSYRVQLAQPIRLPDNPQSRPLMYARNRIAVAYCRSTSDSIHLFCSGLFDAILLDIQAHGNTLPIT